MFFCKKLKETTLTPIENYTPVDKEERLSVAVVEKHGLSKQYSDNPVGEQYFRSGEFVFQVHCEGTTSVTMWKVPYGVLIVGSESTLLIGTVSLACFKHLLYISENKKMVKKTPNPEIVDIFKEYGVHYHSDNYPITDRVNEKQDNSEKELIKDKVRDVAMNLFKNHYANQYPYNAGEQFELCDSVLEQLSQIEAMCIGLMKK